MYDLLKQPSTEGNPAIATSYTTYEQPLNESLRLFLHLEYLFTALDRCLAQLSHETAHEAIDCLIKILHTVDRPDLKTKLTQTLTQHATTLGQLQRFPQVNSGKLESILADLDKHIKSLLQQHTKIGESLKYNEMINQLKHHSSHPSGICRHKVPMFDLWLNQPKEQLHQQISLWSRELRSLAKIIDSILNITRNSTQYHSTYIEQGFYQQTLNLATPCELLRVQIPTNIRAYPEFSVGRHRFTLRILKVDQFDRRPIQLNINFSLLLSLCRI